MTAPLNCRLYIELVQKRHGTPNDMFFIQMLCSWYAEQSELPIYLGLDADIFEIMLATHFSQVVLPISDTFSRPKDFSHMLEIDELRALFLKHRAGISEDEKWLVEILIAGCAGTQHLWRSMGLWSRRELTELLHHNFPNLARQNIHDMKWKKFIYKQLCAEEGIYICRAPSCIVCGDYAQCFGEEI